MSIVKRIASEEYANEKALYEALKAVENIPGKIVAGETFTVGGEEVVAEDGAEIFNNLSKNTATGEHSHAEGSRTTASGYVSHAEGYNTTASGSQSHAEGSGTTASEYYSHSEGLNTTASGQSSHAEGHYTTASGDSSHAEGNITTASGNYSHSEGNNTNAFGSCSHAEGYATNAIGDSSHSEGGSSTTIPSTITRNSTSEEVLAAWNEGKFTAARGTYSHAEGYDTLALELGAHSEGKGTVASGMNSHAEGYETTASGETSHAEGQNTVASGRASHAEGVRTFASGDYSHVQGKENIEDTENKYAHIVGNGDSTTRSNAHTLDWDGNAWFAGDVYVGSTSGTNKDDGSKKLATEEYADNKVVGLATETFVTNKISEAQLGGGGNVDLSGYVSKDDVIDVAHGGTGKTTHTANAVLTGNGTSAVKNVATASGALYATAANGAPKFGVLPYAQGGTGKALSDVPNYAIMRNAGDGDYMWYIATGNGALYATAENGSPKFGTLPIKQGGTGATSESAARSKLGTNMKLLWTNAAPTSTFASFTPMTTSTTNKLAEKPGNFTAIMVWYRTHKSNEIYVSDIIPVGLGSGTDHDNVKQVTECQAAGNDKWCRRYCFVSSTSITFGTGGYRGAVGNNWTVDSTYMIPVRIYGIR